MVEEIAPHALGLQLPRNRTVHGIAERIEGDRDDRPDFLLQIEHYTGGNRSKECHNGEEIWSEPEPHRDRDQRIEKNLHMGAELVERHIPTSTKADQSIEPNAGGISFFTNRSMWSAQ